MKFLQNFSLQFFLFLSLLCSFSSCAPKTDINSAFNKKYGKEVQQTKIERTPSKEMNHETSYSTPPTEEEVIRSLAATSEYFPYVDVAKFGEKVPQSYLPNGEVYELSRAKNPANALPPNMFEIAYNTAVHPPFRRVGIEFDTITIPPEDVYGVKTEMSDKSYLLAGGDAMQKSIDKINNEKTADDIEMSEILIKEQKQLKRKQKMVKIFGQEGTIELASLEKSGEKKDNKKPNEANINSSKAQSDKGNDVVNAVTGFVRNVVKK